MEQIVWLQILIVEIDFLIVKKKRWMMYCLIVIQIYVGHKIYQNTFQTQMNFN